MKEDKLDKEIAASLKKKLVEASVPYEMGAWEGFQKMRAKRRRKAIALWATGIAASLLLLAVGINSVDLPSNQIENSRNVQLSENGDKVPDKAIEEYAVEGSVSENSEPERSVESESNQVPAQEEMGTKPSKVPKSELATPNTKVLAAVPEQTEIPEEAEKPKSSIEPPLLSNEKAIAKVPEKEVTQAPEKPVKIQQEQTFIAKMQEEAKKDSLNSYPEKIALAKPEQTPQPAEKETFIAESDFPEIEKDKTSVGLGMGLSPGFGAIQSDNQVGTASTIGLGMLVDIKLPGKLVLGSGLGLNYLNQNAKQKSTVLSFGNTYPQTEKLEVQQMQVEVPVFVKYPVTRNNSVSIQAGFSNFYALNGNASQEFTVQKQSAFYANDALGNSSVSLRQENVVENNSLESKSGRFYPFATLNFGVNLRVLETKGANYVIMPFYNYQLKQVSGYGDTYGLFGASFKMNFGGK